MWQSQKKNFKGPMYENVKELSKHVSHHHYSALRKE